MPLRGACCVSGSFDFRPHGMTVASRGLDNSALDPLYVELGTGLIVCQGFEQALVLLLAIIEMEDRDIAEGALEAATLALSEDSLGRLLGKLRRKLDLPVEVDERFTAAWKERNWIVHRFLHDSAQTIALPDGMAKIIPELRRRREVVLRAHADAEAIANEYLAQFGNEFEEAQAQAERIWSGLFGN